MPAVAQAGTPDSAAAVAAVPVVDLVAAAGT